MQCSRPQGADSLLQERVGVRAAAAGAGKKSRLLAFIHSYPSCAQGSLGATGRHLSHSRSTPDAVRGKNLSDYAHRAVGHLGQGTYPAYARFVCRAC